MVFVEMVTDHLEGSLAPDVRARVEEHLADCPGCESVLGQMRRVTQVARRLGERDVVTVPAAERAQLLAAFRAARPAR